MQQPPRSEQRHAHGGFMFIELLIVLGVMGVLMSIVIVAINPRKHICEAENAKRHASVRELTNAVNQYQIRTRLRVSDAVIGTGEVNAVPICAAGIFDISCINVDVLAPDYLALLPQDTQETNALYLGYSIYRSAGGLDLIRSNHLQQCTEDSGGGTGGETSGTTGGGGGSSSVSSVDVSSSSTSSMPPSSSASSVAASSVSSTLPIASVTSITYATHGGSLGDKHLDITLTVKNGIIPISGATVSYTVTRVGGGSWNFSAATNASGITSGTVNNAPSGCYSTAVTAVTAAGYTWDGTTPANNFCK